MELVNLIRLSVFLGSFQIRMIMDYSNIRSANQGRSAKHVRLVNYQTSKIIHFYQIIQIHDNSPVTRVT